MLVKQFVVDCWYFFCF